MSTVKKKTKPDKLKTLNYTCECVCVCVQHECGRRVCTVILWMSWKFITQEVPAPLYRFGHTHFGWRAVG